MFHVARTIIHARLNQLVYAAANPKAGACMVLSWVLITIPSSTTGIQVTRNRRGQRRNPWRVVMSTDHPNGGSFLAYPQIIRLLMDRTYRQDMLKAVPAKVREQSVLAELDREYSLSEIAIITRAAPARILGLKHKGHLGPGADADITIYTPDANQETMFELPRHVIKSGRIMVEHGEIREEIYGKTLHVAPEYDRDVEPDIQKWFEESYSIQWRNYPVDIATMHENQVVRGIGGEAQDLK